MNICIVPYSTPDLTTTERKTGQRKGQPGRMQKKGQTMVGGCSDQSSAETRRVSPSVSLLVRCAWYVTSACMATV